MEEKEDAYYQYLQTSEVDVETARTHREITGRYFWNIFTKYGCKDVLDVGCGLGHFIGMAGEGVRAVGVDANAGVVEHCTSEGKSVVSGRADALPFDNGSMDGILCSHLFEHLDDPEKAMSECFRVLRKGGILIVRVPPFDDGFYDDWTHVRPFTKKALSRLASFCGFDIINVYSYSYDLPFRNREHPLFRFVNGMRQMPLIKQAFNAGIKKLLHLPPREIVLIARRPLS